MSKYFNEPMTIDQFEWDKESGVIRHFNHDVKESGAYGWNEKITVIGKTRTVGFQYAGSIRKVWLYGVNCVVWPYLSPQTEVILHIVSSKNLPKKILDKIPSKYITAVT
jgi:hypothetical protein